MSMAWIRKNYRVPAKRGGRVKYTGGRQPQYGKIVGARNQYLLIRLDGESHKPGAYHPTWEITYLDSGRS